MNLERKHLQLKRINSSSVLCLCFLNDSVCPMNMKLDICKYGGTLKMYNKQTFQQKGVEFGVRPSVAGKGGD